MKKSVTLLLVLFMCHFFSLHAEEYALNGSSKLIVEGTVGTIVVNSPGDINATNYYYPTDLGNGDLSKITKLIIKGEINSSDASKLTQDPLSKNNIAYLDLSQTSGAMISDVNGPWKTIVFPSGTDISSINFSNPWQATHFIVAGTPLKVYVRNNSTEYLNDEYVKNATSLYIYDLSTKNEINDENTQRLMDQGKSVNGVTPGVTYKDLTINASTENVAETINNFVSDEQKIDALTVTGNLSDLSVLNGVEAKSVDLSGLTNTDITGLKLPTTDGEIKLPFGVTYYNGKVTISGSTTMEQLKQALSVLKDNGKTFTSVPLPNGGTIENGKITGVATSEVANVIGALKDVVSITGVDFQSGSTFSNGILTVAAADDSTDGLKALADALKDLNITTVTLPDKSTWKSDKTLTVKTDDTAEQDAIKAKLTNAGFEVNEVIVSTVSGQYVTEARGVVTFTMPEGQNWNNVRDNLTQEEKDALKGATNLKLVGKFVNDPDFLNLKSSCTPASLDLTDAIIEQGTVSYTYYYLDLEDKNKRYPLTQEGDKWYYTNKDGNNVYVDDKDVRIYTASVSGGQKMPDEWKKTLTSISLPTNSNYNVVGADFCNGFTNLSEVIIPDNITVIGNNAFHSAQNLKNVTLPPHLIALCENAFYKTGLTEVSIPGSVEIISKMAFTECEQVTKLVFEESDPDHHMIVKYYGFFNLEKLRDIYIQTSALIDCENDAFDFRITWGQGDGKRDMCTLHFKADVADHYANLKHPLTKEIAKDAGKFHKWLESHYAFASNPGANGWWEFVNNGTIGDNEQDAVKGAKFLRTYSDYHYDRIVPQGVKAYIVTGLEGNANEGFKLKLKSLFVIPKRTGVILYGVANSKDENGEPILSMSLCEIANSVPLRRDYWNYLAGDDAEDMKNYLWPTCVTLDPEGYVEEPYSYYNLDKDGNVVTKESGEYDIQIKIRKVLKEATEPSHVKPYDQQTKYATPDGAMEGYDATSLNGFYRNFYMSRYGSTESGKKYKKANGDKIESNFVGFFRAKSSNIKPNMAYLRLEKEEYTDANGGEVIITPDRETFKYDGTSYDMESYQAEYSKEDGKPILPSKSGYWVKGGDPDTQWDIDTNWGDRTKITNKTSGAKFVAVRFSGEPEIIEEEDGTATMIIPASMIEQEEADVYYNLQGMKVANPQKGIYIKNGKKIVIK